MAYSFHGKSVFITGGTGTWGQEFTRHLLAASASRIRILSRGEYRQVEMRRAFQHHANIDYMIGDVRDLSRLQVATRGFDIMIHLAALKHVPIVEENAREALMTNTLGTQNVIDAVMANGIERCLFVSSDKAVNPLNFYGITKLAAERMTIIANRDSATQKFITYRAGNVMGSAGSVVPIFQETLNQSNSIKLTDPAMTRFFIAKGEVVRRACSALLNAHGGEIFVPQMKAASLDLLAKIMIRRLGKGDVKIDHIGVRPGEKTHEQLISRDECRRTKLLENLWVILPDFAPAELLQHYLSAPNIDFAEYASDTAPQFTPQELEDLLESESFLTPLSHSPTSQLYFKKNTFEFH